MDSWQNKLGIFSEKHEAGLWKFPFKGSLVGISHKHPLVVNFQGWVLSAKALLRPTIGSRECVTCTKKRNNVIFFL